MKLKMIVGIAVMCLSSASVPTLAGSTRAAPASQRLTFQSPSLSSSKPSRPTSFRGRYRRAATVIVFPHVAAYLLPPQGVVSSPYFCLYHNEAFVSRIGMIDHLSGMHDLPLTTAASLCPDANGNCIFPSD